MSSLAKDKAFLAILALGLAAFLMRDSLAMGASAVTGSDSFTQWDRLFIAYGRQYRVPWRWLKAICMNESSLGQDESVQTGLSNPKDVEGSKSSDGLSWGLMQLTLRTARALEGPEVDAVYLNNPENSVRLAAKLLAELIDRYGIEDRESIIRDYNGGPRKGPLTVGYYAKFVTHLAIVLGKQSGDELEGYQ